MNTRSSPSKTRAAESPCDFCGSNVTDEIKSGKLHRLDDITAHYFCLLLSSGLSQNGAEDEGILGFLAPDIKKEIRRGKRLRCSACKKVGATIGCCNRSCKKAFHLPCSLQKKSLHLFYGNFMTYCCDHRPGRKGLGKSSVSNVTCCVCLLAVNLKDPYEVLRPPCCKNGYFHKECIQRQAVTAGYFFKCPLCNNTDDFKQEMLNLGIFIPEQDAAWELEQNAFQDLYERHSRCDAPICNCPKGRKYDKDDCPWEVVLCTECGSEGCHIECGNISTKTRDWQCPNCSIVLNKMKAKQKQPDEDVTVIDSDSISSSPRLQLSSEDDSSPKDGYVTPENQRCPSPPRTPPRLRPRQRFAQLNEYKYNLSPNHDPIGKDDLCTNLRTSPRTTKNIYSRRHRVCSLRELRERHKRLKAQQKLQRGPVTRSTSPEIVELHFHKEKTMTKEADHDENQPGPSHTSQNERTPTKRVQRVPVTRSGSTSPEIVELHFHKNTTRSTVIKEGGDHDENQPGPSHTSQNEKTPTKRRVPVTRSGCTSPEIVELHLLCKEKTMIKDGVHEPSTSYAATSNQQNESYSRPLTRAKCISSNNNVVKLCKSEETPNVNRYHDVSILKYFPLPDDKTLMAPSSSSAVSPSRRKRLKRNHPSTSVSSSDIRNYFK